MLKKDMKKVLLLLLELVFAIVALIFVLSRSTSNLHKVFESWIDELSCKEKAAFV